MFPGRRQLGLHGRAAADDAESRGGRGSPAVRATSACDCRLVAPPHAMTDAADVARRRAPPARFASAEARAPATLRAPAGIDLSSNDYLGLAADPRVKQRADEAVASRRLRQHRLAAAARRSRRRSPLVESRFAQFKGTERALYFSSGYLANLAVLTTFPERGRCRSSPTSGITPASSTASGCRRRDASVFPHNDVDALARLLA